MINLVNLLELIWRHLCQSFSFLIRLQICNFIKKGRLWHRWHQNSSNSLIKIVIIQKINFNLEVNFILKSEASNNVQRQTKRAPKNWHRESDLKLISSLVSQVGTKCITNMVIDKSKRQKFIRKPLWVTANVYMKICALDLLQRSKNKI